MQKTIITRKELSERWGVSPTTVDDYENKGYIRRVNLPGCQFSIASIEKIEYDGTDNLLIRKDREIRDLKVMLAEKEEIISKIRSLATY